MICWLGTWVTASAHIITAVIGSGVLSLAWAIAQMGWVAGPAVLFAFSFITYFTSTLLADCYRSPDPVHGKRNYTYSMVVRSILGILHYITFSQNTNSTFYNYCSTYVSLFNFIVSNIYILFYYIGGRKFQLCGLAQYINLVGVTIGYTITASISMV